MEHMDFLALTDFNLVARHGGFGRAARESGRPKATLSRRVADLESALDLRLFERGARALKLTEEGRALYERTSVLLTELDETAAQIASGGGAPRGRLRVSAPLLFSQAAMGKLAAGFALKYRDVHLEVTTEDRPVDMVEEGYDLVIRVNPDPDARLVGRIFRAIGSSSWRARRSPGRGAARPPRPWCVRAGRRTGIRPGRWSLGPAGSASPWSLCCGCPPCSWCATLSGRASGRHGCRCRWSLTTWARADWCTGAMSKGPRSRCGCSIRHAGC
jgi:DNA-binding transcriptional LysR family regulator